MRHNILATNISFCVFFKGLLMAGFFFLLLSCLVEAKESPVRLWEVQVFGNNGQSGHDFIELHNLSNDPISLRGWQLKKRTESGTESSIKSITEDIFIEPGGYFVWANSKDGFAQSIRADVSTSSGTIAQTNTILLYDGERSLIDEVYCSDADPDSASYGYDDTRSLWRWSRTSTPRNPNIFPEKPVNKFAHTIRINEILPNPSGDEKTSEFIELYNFGADPVDLSGWELRDASTSGKYVVPRETILDFGEYGVFLRSEFSFALNNTAEKIFLIDPSGGEVDTMSYERTKENISWSYDGLSWRLTSYSTPGAENKFDNPPKSGKISIEEDIYIDTWADFSVELSEKDSKIVWDFGDGHKSYKAQTRHRYTTKGKFVVNLKIQGKSEDREETYSIEVKKFPELKIRLNSVMPNPAGKDTGIEWIEVINKTKKTVDLMGWSIATGTKKLVNHPIRKHIEIKPGKSFRITKKHAAITLPNVSGKIELRYPNGEVAHSIKYVTKEKSIPEDALWIKSKGGKWHWEYSQKQEKKVDDMTSEELKSESDIQKKEKDKEILLAPDPIIYGVQSEREIEHRVNGIFLVSLHYASKTVLLPAKNSVVLRDGIYRFSQKKMIQRHYLGVWWENLLARCNSVITNAL